MKSPERSPTSDSGEITRLFAKYAERLTRIAEKQLSGKLGGRIDGEDVVQSVFRTLFKRQARGELRIDSSVEIWRLLVRITLTKSRHKGRHHTALKRDVSLEVPGEEWFAEALQREPGPAEAATLLDQIEHILRDLPDLHRNVLELRLAGHSASEVATSLEVSRQTVYRVLRMLQDRMRVI